MRPLAITVFGLGMLAPSSHAQWAGSDGMAFQMACEVYTLGSGNLMLMVGFLVAVYGLYRMILHAAYKTGIILIICGALLTALPGIVVSSLNGVNTWLRNAELTDMDITPILSGIQSYAGHCQDIHIDMSDYEQYVDRDMGANPLGAEGARGKNVYRPDSEADRIMEDKSIIGQNLPCAGRVIDTSSGQKPVITSGYGWRGKVAGVAGASAFHAALDFGPRPRTPLPRIIAAQGGVVVKSGVEGGCGQYVKIEHGGEYSGYCHLNQRAVRVGESVSAGQVIGIMGNTGLNGMSPHLHFQWKTGAGKAVDPRPKIGC